MKCSACKKKTVIVFTCKCSKEVCIKHRAPEDHECLHQYELFKVETPILKEKVIKI